MPLPRLLILPALAAVFAFAVPASPASALPPASCPCWDAGGPFYTPKVWCYASPATRFGYVVGTFARTVDYGPVSFCQKNASYIWTSPSEHAACNAALNLACADIFAVAYIDVNNDNSFNRGDGLIAKLVDATGDGTANAGDVMVTDVYPATALNTAVGGEFSVKASPCSFVSVDGPPPQAHCQVGPVGFVWRVGLTFEEFMSTDDFLNFVDLQSSSGDSATASSSSPLGPTADQSGGESSPGDQNYIDVDIFAPSAPF